MSSCTGGSGQSWCGGLAGLEACVRLSYPVFIKLFVPSVLAPLWNFRSLVSRTQYVASLQHRNLTNSETRS